MARHLFSSRMEQVIDYQRDVAQSLAEIDQLVAQVNKSSDVAEKSESVLKMSEFLQRAKSNVDSLLIVVKNLVGEDHGKCNKIYNELEAKVRSYDAKIKEITAKVKKERLFEFQNNVPEYNRRGIDETGDESLLTVSELKNSNQEAMGYYQDAMDEINEAIQSGKRTKEQVEENLRILQEQGVKLALIDDKVTQIDAEMDKGKNILSRMFKRHRMTCIYGICLGAAVVLILVIFLGVHFGTKGKNPDGGEEEGQQEEATEEETGQPASIIRLFI